MVERIAQLLAGRSNRWLSAEVGVTEQAVSNWFNQGKKPSSDKLVSIANALNTTTDYLLGRTDDPSPPRPGAPGSGTGPEATPTRAELERMRADLLSVVERISAALDATSSPSTSSPPARRLGPAAIAMGYMDEQLADDTSNAS